MIFEYDPQKSTANLAKHGIDFDEAQHMWLDIHRLEVRARTQGEPRWVLLARLRDRVWAAVFTYRQDRVRIISVRRARTREVLLYEND